MMFRNKMEARRRPSARHGRASVRRLGLALVTASLLVAGVTSATQLLAMSPPGASRSRTVDMVRELFPQTQGWFRIVASETFTTDPSGGPNGRLVPNYASLTHERVRWQDASGHTLSAQFARRFRGATRISSGEDPGAWIEVIPQEGSDVAAEIQDGLVVYPNA